MNSFSSNNHYGSVSVYNIHEEPVVMVAPNGDKPSTRIPAMEPQKLTRSPQTFIDDLVAALGKDAIILPHESISDRLYAGSERYGFVLTVKPGYEAVLRSAIEKVNAVLKLPE